MTNGTRQAPGGRQRAQHPYSSLVLRRPAQAKSTETSGKGCYIGATRPRLGGRQDGGHRGAQDDVTTELFACEYHFCQDSLYSLSPLEVGHCGIPSLLTFGKRTRASINRTSHHHRGDGSIPPQAHHQAQEHLSSRGCSSLVLFIISPRGNPPHHTQE